MHETKSTKLDVKFHSGYLCMAKKAKHFFVLLLDLLFLFLE